MQAELDGSWHTATTIITAAATILFCLVAIDVLKALLPIDHRTAFLHRLAQVRGIGGSGRVDEATLCGVCICREMEEVS
jgi:hypothetical protein